MIEDAIILGNQAAIITVTGDTTLDRTHSIVLVDASSGVVTITLPDVSEFSGFQYAIKKIDTSSNDVTIDGDGANIDDVSTKLLSGPGYPSMSVGSDGSEWHNLKSHLINPTENNYPYKKDDTLKDSQVSYDETLDIIISSVAGLLPQTVMELSTDTTHDIPSHVYTVIADGDMTLNFEDRNGSGIPLSIRNISGTQSFTADSGTVESTTLTFGNGVKFIQEASDDWTEIT